MSRLKPLSRCTVLAILMVVMTIGAQAGLIPVLVGGVPTDNLDGTFTYNYYVNLSASSEVGDFAHCQCFLTMIDFNGYIPGSAVVDAAIPPSNIADWMVSEQMVGPPAFMQTPVDDPNQTNITFRYCGTAPLVGPLDFPDAVMWFSLKSDHNVSSSLIGVYDGQTAAVDPDLTIQGNSGQYLGPDVPEPGVMAWLVGIGVCSSTMAFRRRRPGK